MAAFCEKSLEEFIHWLAAENEFSESVIESLKENEIDRESFLLLTDGDIFDMVKPIGTRRRLIAKRDELKNSTLKEISRKVESGSANGQQRTNTDRESVPSENDCYHTDDEPGSEIIWEDDVEFSLSQYQDVDNNYEPTADLSAASGDETDENQSAEPLPSSSNDSAADKEDRDSLSPQVDTDSPTQLKKEAFCSFNTSWYKEEPPLPDDFQLPLNYPRDVMAGLHKKRLNGHCRAKFISSICSAIFRYKAFPTKEEYRSVGLKVIEKYPFLQSKSGSGYGYLVEAMSDRMKNIRNAKPRGASKRPLNADTECTVVKKPRREFKQFPKLLESPVIPAGEDEHSYKRHMQLLKHEEGKISPDKHAINSLMTKTYVLRRQKILKEHQPLKELLKDCPSLKRCNQILAELDRIVQRCDATREMSEIWMETVPKIIAVANEENNPHLRVLCDDAKGPISEVSRSIVATMMLAYLLPDTRTAAKSSRLIIFTSEFSDASTEAKNADYPQPVVIIRGQAKAPKDGYLVVENRIMSKIDLADVPLILFASYYVFNMQYCTGCTNVFSFLEVLFLNAPPIKRTKLKNFLNCLDSIDLEC